MLMETIISTRKLFTHIPRSKHIEPLEQINTDSGRFYKGPTGVLYPSVTTVTGIMNKHAIKVWRESVGEEEANRITKKATSRGTRVHQLCEDYINNAPLSEKSTIIDLEAFIPLMKIIDENIDNVHMQEERLYSDHLQMAGTVDCIAEYAGKLAIIDFKTARKPKLKEYITNYFCQATAYAIMYEELFGISIPRLVIMISVDNEPPQVFFEKRDNWIDKLMEVREQYRKQYNG